MQRRAGILIGALASAAAAQPIAAQERFSSSAADVAVYNVVGQVRVEPGSGASVVVEVTRVGPDGARLRVENGMVRGHNAIRVIYPEDHIIYRVPGMGRFSRTDFRVRDDGTFDDERLFSQRAEAEPGAVRSAMHFAFGEGHKVTISGGGSGLDAHADLRVLVPNGRRVAVILGMGRLYARNVNGDIVLRTHSGDIEADRVGGRLAVESGSGDVRLSDSNARIDLHTGSGDLLLERLRGSYLGAATGSGDVKGTDFEATELRANTGSGDIVLSNVRSPDLVIDTGSGDVELRLESDVSSLRAHTGSGDVTIGVPGTLGAAIQVDTGSGDVESDVPLNALDRRRSHLRGTIGDGRGDIRIETGSGDVHLVKR
jgi:hypothetical protein